MYNALDTYIDVDTWHTTHPNDDQRFYKALNMIVRNRDFDPQKMADYMRQKVGASGVDLENIYEQAIEKREGQAWAISEFLKVTE